MEILFLSQPEHTLFITGSVSEICKMTCRVINWEDSTAKKKQNKNNNNSNQMEQKNKERPSVGWS